MRLVVLVALGLAIPVAEAGGRSGGRGPVAPVAPIPLRDAPIRDLPTTVSVPVSAGESLVLALHAGFWLQCPRHLPVPTSLDGQGLVFQYLNPRGGSVTMLYVGSVPLPPPEPEDTPDGPASRAAADFAALLGRKYDRVDWRLLGGPVPLAPSTVRLGGKKTTAWRTARYTLEPKDYGGPRSVFSGECVLFRPPGSDRLAYVAVDAKGGGTTLDRAIERMSIVATHAVNPAPRRVQWNDLAESQDDGRYPTRCLAFEMPAGFVPTPALAEVRGEWVFVEERLDATGKPDATLRVDGRPADRERTLEQDAEDERGAWREEDRTPLEAVDLAARGHRAYVFSHPAPPDVPGPRAHTAVLRLDDRLLVFTWVARSDAAQAERDRALLVGMLRTVEMSVRR